MKKHIKLLLVAVGFTPVFSSAMADPVPATVTTSTVRPLSDQTRRALVPPPITEPCRAELSVDRVEISRRADRSAFDITVTVRNSGTEAATGPNGVLGLRVDVTSIYRPRTEVVFTKQVADIDVIQPGTSRSYGFSLSSREIKTDARGITIRLDRGPDGPRCAYDARANNDGLGISGSTMRASFEAGNARYVRVAPWAM